MLLEGVNLDQVFRNVRAEVLELTNEKQMTEESTQLTGETFYLLKNTFTDKLAAIDSLIKNENYLIALEKTGAILNEDDINIKALAAKIKIYFSLGSYEGPRCMPFDQGRL